MMRNISRIICLHMLTTLIFTFSCTKGKKTDGSSVTQEKASLVSNNLNIDRSSNIQEEQTFVNDDPDCVEFVALWSASDIAEQIGRDKKWVFLNYTVNLWDIPPADGIGNTVGILRASSYARIIEKRGDDYKVESPVGKVQGWISNEHVKTISKKNPKTRALCE